MCFIHKVKDFALDNFLALRIFTKGFFHFLNMLLFSSLEIKINRVGSETKT